MIIITTMSSVQTPKNTCTDGELTCWKEYSTQQMGQQEFSGKTGTFGTHGPCQYGSGQKNYNPFSLMAVVPTRSSQIHQGSGEIQVRNSTTQWLQNTKHLFQQVKIKL